MAGHSQFKNIMYRKGAQDKKRAKLFTKLIREITVAAKLGGVDESANPRLRSALIEARANNMPKDNIQRAIKKADSNNDADNFELIVYEGYAAHGVAVIVEVLTDNRNRSATEVRTVFSKKGGNLGASGSVSYLFNHIGYITFNAADIKLDDLIENALIDGVIDIVQEGEDINILVDYGQEHEVYKLLQQALPDVNCISIGLTWRPVSNIQLDNIDHITSIINIIDALEELNDVQNVFTNIEFDPSILEDRVV